MKSTIIIRHLPQIALAAICAIFSNVAPAAADQPTTWPDLATAGKAVGGGENDVALLVAVSAYPELDGAMQVPGAVENLAAWKHWLKNVRGVPQVYTLTDGEVGVDDILEKAQKVGQLVKPGGTLWFLFIGHGMPHPTERSAMLMTHAADARHPERNSIALGEVVKRLTAKQPKQTVLIVDTCFAGGSDHGGKSVFAGTQASVTVKKSVLEAATAGTITLTAGGADDLAGALPNARRPAFSYLLLGGLMGWADGAMGVKADGVVSVEEAIGFANGAMAYANKLKQTPEFSPQNVSTAATILTKSAGIAKVDVETLMAARGGAQAPAQVQRAAVLPARNGPQISGSQVDDGDTPLKGPVISGSDVSAAFGRLIVKATPKDATVQVTGPSKFRQLGTAGWERADLQPGQYTVEVAAAGFEAQKQTLALVSDDVQTVKIALQRLGGLEITGTPPGSKVEVHGPDGFSTVQGLPLKIADTQKGNYTLKVSKAGYETAEYNAAVHLGETEKVVVTLKQPGTLEIRGTPVGAQVAIVGPNGFAVTKGLPVKIEGAASGVYKVTVSREGWATVEKSVVVRAGEVAGVDLVLERQRQVAPVPAPMRSEVAVGVAWRQPQVDAAIALGKGTFRANGDGTVTQPGAGLVWEQGEAGKDLNWRDAYRYCASLSLAGGGWRLPSVGELVRLIDKSREEGKRVDVAFVNSFQRWVWTGSPYLMDERDTWVVNFDAGGTNAFRNDIDITDFVRARCVR